MTYQVKYRLLEMIPGILVWTTLIGLIVISLTIPLWAIYFIIIFDFYWLLRVLYMLFYMLHSWMRYRKSIKVNWLEKLEVSHSATWRNYYHLIFYPTYKEPYSVVSRSFESLITSTYPKDKLIVVLAGEERDSENFNRIRELISRDYSKKFFRLYFTLHPKNNTGEIPGKGSNLHYAGTVVKEYIKELNIPLEKIIVSSFDIDTCPHVQYFSCLTYHYLSSENPTKMSYQPIAIYNNNVWQSNPIIRVVSSSTTFWLFTDLARPERLFTFSSHSMSYKALVDVNFWDKTIVTEDSRIFLQCFVYYHGHYRVQPLYMPVFMNTVDIGNFTRSLISQYKQIRRWAWGIEHFPWMMVHFFGRRADKKISFKKKLHYLWNQTEGVYSWATAPVLIYLMGHLPLWFASEDVEQTSLFQNAPDVLSILMRISMIGIMVISLMYSIMLPPKPKNYAWLNYIIMFLQWLLAPITLLIFGSIPAIDAITRLMIGGRWKLDFWTTEKR